MDGSVVFAGWRQCAPPSNMFPLPTRVHILSNISISSAVFGQLTAECPYTLQWATPPPSKLPLGMGDLDIPSNAWFLGPIQVHNPNGIGRFRRFCRAHDRDRQTDRPTAKPRFYVCNNRPQRSAYVVLRCGLKYNQCVRIGL